MSAQCASHHDGPGCFLSFSSEEQILIHGAREKVLSGNVVLNLRWRIETHKMQMTRQDHKIRSGSPNPQFRIHHLNNFVLLQNSVTIISNPSKFPLTTNIMQREIEEQQGRVISLNLPLTISEAYILKKLRVGGTSCCSLLEFIEHSVLSLTSSKVKRRLENMCVSEDIIQRLVPR